MNAIYIGTIVYPHCHYEYCVSDSIDVCEEWPNNNYCDFVEKAYPVETRYPDLVSYKVNKRLKKLFFTGIDGWYKASFDDILDIVNEEIIL